MTDRATGPRAAPLPLRERIVVLVALGGLSAWAWVWLATMPAMDGTGPGGGMLNVHGRAWSPADAAAMLAMWAIMMIGMMVPSAAPMVLLYARMAKRGLSAWRARVRTALFIGGYVAAWTAFSVAATAAQWTLERLALLTPMMTTASPYLGGALLVVAGVYQLTPAKRACLDKCRTPFLFVTSRWRAGGFGAFVMGLDHGAYCVGCCWMLMALLFVVGVMNLLWVAIIAAFVLAEKIAPGGEALSKLAGAALVMLGAYVAASGL